MQPTPPILPRRNNNLRTGGILQTAISVAILLATLFVAFPVGVLSSNLSEQLALLLTPQPEAYPLAPTEQRVLRIGIVSGHWENANDPGAVCPDGTTEVKVNLTIATLVQQKLSAQGFQVDLLQEFDPRLEGYQAVVMVSIHNDTSDYLNNQATGYKIAASMSNRDPNRANRLTACLRDRYAQVTGLSFHPGSITNDMTDYHSFEEIDPVTTAAIIEAGFLNLDKTILTQEPGRIADGIVAGILCYINNESIAPTPTPLTP